ncbi:MAG: SphA family protein [Sulfitobacter sp.]
MPQKRIPFNFSLPKLCQHLSAAALCTFGLLSGPAEAGEGGGSHYVQGTRNDFLIGVFGPPGVYLRNDIFYLDLNIGKHIAGGRAVASANQKVTINTTKLSYLSDTEIWGGRYGASIGLSYVLDASISGQASLGGAPAFARAGSGSGLSDIYVVPFMLNWTQGNHHFTGAIGTYVPTGGYDIDRKINTGRNYWSPDLTGSYTYFDPQAGYEISVSAGVMYNFENPATDYRSGSEFHLDWTVAQHFKNGVAAGLSGYWLQQLEGDSGTIAGPISASSIKGYSLGIGPSVQANIPLSGGKSLGIVAKALFDIDSRDRFNGDMFMLSASYKF